MITITILQSHDGCGAVGGGFGGCGWQAVFYQLSGVAVHTPYIDHILIKLALLHCTTLSCCTATQQRLPTHHRRPHRAPMAVSSDEVNLLVYRYLLESGRYTFQPTQRQADAHHAHPQALRTAPLSLDTRVLSTNQFTMARTFHQAPSSRLSKKACNT